MKFLRAFVGSETIEATINLRFIYLTALEFKWELSIFSALFLIISCNYRFQKKKKKKKNRNKNRADKRTNMKGTPFPFVCNSSCQGQRASCKWLLPTKLPKGPSRYWGTTRTTSFSSKWFGRKACAEPTRKEPPWT